VFFSGPPPLPLKDCVGYGNELDQFQLFFLPTLLPCGFSTPFLRSSGLGPISPAQAFKIRFGDSAPGPLLFPSLSLCLCGVRRPNRIGSQVFLATARSNPFPVSSGIGSFPFCWHAVELPPRCDLPSRLAKQYCF